MAAKEHKDWGGKSISQSQFFLVGIGGSTMLLWMTIPALGNLLIDDNEQGLRSVPVPIPLLASLPLHFTLVDLAEAGVSDVNHAVSAFLSLGSDARANAATAVYNNFLEMREACCYEDVGCDIASEARVWEHVQPTQVDIFRRSEDGHIYVQLMAECGWEREHGLQLLFREGKELVDVGDQGEGLAWRD